MEVNTVNLLKHGDFEDTSIDLKPHQDPHQLDYWYIFPPGKTKPVKVNNNAHTGEWAVKLSATEDAVEQDVAGLKEGATYIATVWAKATNPGSATAYFGVKNYGGSEIKVKIDSSEYKQYTIPFTYTGVSGKYPRIYVWVQSMSGGEIYVDDFSLIVDSDLQSLDIENGKLTAEYQADFAGTPLSLIHI